MWAEIAPFGRAVNWRYKGRCFDPGFQQFLLVFTLFHLIIRHEMWKNVLSISWRTTVAMLTTFPPFYNYFLPAERRYISHPRLYRKREYRWVFCVILLWLFLFVYWRNAVQTFIIVFFLSSLKTCLYVTLKEEIYQYLLPGNTHSLWENVMWGCVGRCAVCEGVLCVRVCCVWGCVGRCEGVLWHVKDSLLVLILCENVRGYADLIASLVYIIA